MSEEHAADAADDAAEESAGEARPGPSLAEVDDSESGRFRAAPGAEAATRSGSGAAWRPGVVEVEFAEPEAPRAMLEGHGPGGASEGAAGWPEWLSQVLEGHGCVGWERTFPAARPWPAAGAEESPRARAIAADRDRFITFHFRPEADVARAAAELRGLPQIARAAPVPGLAPPSQVAAQLLGAGDQLNRTHFCGPHSCLHNQWYIFRCGVERAWGLLPGGVSGRGVVLADVDWGFLDRHVELRARIAFKHDVVRDRDGIVANGSEIHHGTAVLGLAGAANAAVDAVSGFGMVGVAYEAELWAVQAGDDQHKEHHFWARAIDLVRDRDAQGRRKVLLVEIQTARLGNIEQSLQISQAIRDAVASGVVVCVAAGNGGRDAGLADDGLTEIAETGAILVGATRFDPDPAVNERADSNFGDRVTVYAPGDRLSDLTCSHLALAGYRNRFGGTSGAAAKVAGVAALMLQANDQLTHEEVRDILRDTGSPVTDDPDKPGRFLAAERAVLEALRRAGQPD